MKGTQSVRRYIPRRAWERDGLCLSVFVVKGFHYEFIKSRRINKIIRQTHRRETGKF